MIVLSVLHSPSSVLVSLGPDDAVSGGSGEVFALSPGEWKRLERSLGGGEDSPFLVPGQPVDEPVYDAIRDAADRTKALRDAANLLNFSDRSRRALIRRLKERGHAAGAAEYAVSYLEKKGFLNDRAACEQYAASAVRSKRIGRRRIEADLLAKGFSREDAKAAAGSVPEEDLRAALNWQIRRNYPVLLEKDADPAERRKAAAALMRKGFEAEEIRKRVRSEE